MKQGRIYMGIILFCVAYTLRVGVAGLGNSVVPIWVAKSLGPFDVKFSTNICTHVVKHVAALRR